MRYRPKHIAEYAALRAVTTLLRSLPYPIALFTGWLCAWTSHFLLRFRVREAHTRVRQVFGDTVSERDVRRIAWGSWRNMAFAVVDLPRLPSVSRRWIDRMVEHGPLTDALLEQAETGQGAIMAAPHMGSWELGGIACQRVGLSVFYVVGKQKNPLYNAWIDRLRTGGGIATIEKDGALRAVLRRLRKGETLALLPDVRSRTEAIAVRFLGAEANVPAGVALFARQTGVPIFPCYSTRVGWTRHRLHLDEPIRPDPDLEKRADIERMTQAVFDAFERAIRAYPDQWFWYNKRWILDPLQS